jgi:nicotinate-nucleotide pyrophosphorylase
LQYGLHYIDCGTSSSLKTSLITYSDTTPAEIFTKQRIVSSGLRFFKTSASDTESGVLNMYYSRDGAAMDEKATF